MAHSAKHALMTANRLPMKLLLWRGNRVTHCQKPRTSKDCLRDFLAVPVRFLNRSRINIVQVPFFFWRTETTAPRGRNPDSQLTDC